LTLGFLLDAILILVVLEAIVLGVWVLRRQGRVPAIGLLANLAAGFFLLLAARAAWVDEPELVMAALLGALAAHLADLGIRFRRV
jgi:hypothetical protein